MFFLSINAQGGFTPAALAPPECDNFVKVIQLLDRVIQLLNMYYIIIALSAGAVRGDRHCPLLHLL
jgi:hypothetical protein